MSSRLQKFMVNLVLYILVFWGGFIAAAIYLHAS